MASHKYWRLNITSNYGAGATTVTDVNLYSPSGTVLNTVGGNGSASASSTQGGTSSASAFDNNATTQWQSADGTFPCWVKWSFPAAQDVDIVSLKNYSGNATFFPQAVMFQWSDDDSSWTDYGGFTNPNTLSAVTYFIPTRSVTVDASLPMLTLASEMGPSFDITLPMLTLAADFGISADPALPTLTLVSDFGAAADNLTLPMLTLDASMHQAEGENHVDVTLPMLTLEADMGGQINGTLPMPTLDAAMTGTAVITVDITLPMLTLDAGMTASEVVTFDLRLPMLTLESYFGGEVQVDLPMVTLGANITAGGLITFDLRLPMFTLDAQATRQNSGWIEATLPMLVPVASITADLTLPMLQLDAQITAVVAVTYEGYAVNLRAEDGTVGGFQVSHYTGFPFLQILRFQGHYYGLAADGLYKLEGADDAGAAIPWNWKTGFTDFGTSHFKQVNSVYVGGRRGVGSVFTSYHGESAGGAVAQTHANVRLADAQTHRQKFGMGNKATYFALGEVDATGGAMDTESLDFEVNVLKRKV